MTRRKLLRAAAVLIVVVGAGALFTWYNFFREEPQPEWITGDPIRVSTGYK